MEDIRKNSLEVIWRIENVNSWFQTRDDTLYSPQFLADTLMNTRWKLSLSPNWLFGEKYLSLAVQRYIEDDGPEFIALNYKLSFLSCDESQTISKSYKSKFASKTTGPELNVKQVEILKDKKEIYLPDGVLTVCCKFWYSWPTVSKGAHFSIRSVIGTKSITLDSSIDNVNAPNAPSTFILNFNSPYAEIRSISFCFETNGNNTPYFERKDFELKCYNRYWYSCRLFVLNAGGQQILCCDENKLKTLLTSNNSCKVQSHYYWSNYQQFLRNGNLLFQLQITYFPGVQLESIEYDINHSKKSATDMKNVNTSYSDDLSLLQIEKINNIEETESNDENDCFDCVGNQHLLSTTLKSDLTALYNDRLFCDTKLQTDTETFPAHKNILSARSPVFKKMFTSDMKEAAGECINIQDISTNTISRMLEFLYTDCIGDLEMQSAKDLYVASDKYDIVSLKQRCLSFMKKNLCPSNVCDLLLLADMHQDKDLESAANEYVLNYDEEVFGSEEWKLFMQNYSGLAARVMFLKLRKNM